MPCPLGCQVGAPPAPPDRIGSDGATPDTPPPPPPPYPPPEIDDDDPDGAVTGSLLTIARVNSMRVQHDGNPEELVLTVGGCALPARRGGLLSESAGSWLSTIGPLARLDDFDPDELGVVDDEDDEELMVGLGNSDEDDDDDFDDDGMDGEGQSLS